MGKNRRKPQSHLRDVPHLEGNPKPKTTKERVMVRTRKARTRKVRTRKVTRTTRIATTIPWTLAGYVQTF
eukprot:201718-Amphidinium_carterae.1